jgi:hypothetical protein
MQADSSTSSQFLQAWQEVRATIPEIESQLAAALRAGDRAAIAYLVPVVNCIKAMRAAARALPPSEG